MANSRSNIYPVQLQGAELNLNKLDAEIKQYSGFNKNNAPFVGGCLSNIFTKDETIEGGNGENVYIDTNGDIYEIKSDGFYKNNNKIKSIQAPFVNLKKLTSPIYAHRYFSEKNLVTLINRDIYLNDAFIAEMDDSQTDDDILNKYITGIHVKYNDEVYFIFACKGWTKFRLVVWNMTTEELVLDYISIDQIDKKNVDITFPVTIFFDDTTGKISVYFTRDEDNGSGGTNYYSYVYISSDFTTEGSIGRVANSFECPEFNKTSTDVLISDYRYASGFGYIGYPYNLIIVKNSIGKAASATSNKWCYAFKYDFTTTTTDYLKLNYENALKQNITSNERYYNATESYKDDYTPLFKSGCIAMKNAVNSPSMFVFFNPFGIYYPVKTEDDNLYLPASNIEFFNNYVLMFNNGVLSAIAVKYNECNAVLISNWNLINPFSLSFVPNDNDEYYSLYYQEDGKYYCITLDDIPRMRKVLDQLVTNNITSNYNSYFLKRNTDRWGLFAPGFNCAIRINNDPTLKSDYCTTSTIALGAAVNEYKEENNPSILLNPLNYLNPHSASGIGFLSLGFVGIDVFEGAPSYEYEFTWLPDDTRYNKDLIGLPYPVQTDGNVQYSLSLFADVESEFGNETFVKSENIMYPLVKGNENKPIMAYFLASGIENLQTGFIIQGQFYGIFDNQLYSLQFANGVIADLSYIVSVEGLQYVGNTPYEALFFSKTNRCLYSFTGANVLNQKQFIDKISEVRNYLYNPATQTVFLVTDIGVLFYGLFGQFLLEYPDISKIFLLQNGIVMSDNAGNYRYIKYYLDESDTDFVKENIRLETCFYGMNNQTVTINDCLYMRIFSEEHEEGNLEVSATTLSLKGRMTEKTTFRIKERDWDKLTHTIYLRYQPKEQRGLGISFSINSPFKIASLSIGSQADAILIDKVSKGAINAPQITSNNVEW